MEPNRRTSVEIQAVTVEDAVRLALEQLGRTRDEVDIEILSDAGPDEDAEALVRVTAKGMASQPVPGASSAGRRTPSPRRAPGDRPSSRGTPPPHLERSRPVERLGEVEPVRAAPEDERAAKEVVVHLLSLMRIDADVVAVDNPSSMPLSQDDPPTIFIDILGRDLGMLIGRRGENLAQLQYITNLLVNRKLGTWTRVILDVEGYRSRREESLIGLAERVAKQVARSHRPVMLEPMPPNERRIVHLTLRGNPDVTTESSGEGSMRRVTVQPRG